MAYVSHKEIAFCKDCDVELVLLNSLDFEDNHVDYYKCFECGTVFRLAKDKYTNELTVEVID